MEEHSEQKAWAAAGAQTVVRAGVGGGQARGVGGTRDEGYASLPWA